LKNYRKGEAQNMDINQIKEQLLEMKEVFTQAFLEHSRAVSGICIAAAVAVAGAFMLPGLLAPKSNAPVTEMKATNNDEYKPGEEINPKDFKVMARHTDGKETQLGKNDFTVSPSKANGYKATTPVTITLKKTQLKIHTSVKNKRKKVCSWNVGNPAAKEVKAVYYDTGELSFEGAGNIMSFDDENAPWIANTKDEDIEIKSVTFGKDVTPKTLDYDFKNLESLTYVDPIPDTVESIRDAFSGCIKLKKMPDWSKADGLLDAENAFSGCTALTETYPTPANIVSLNDTFSGCESLIDAPDMSGSVNINSMEEAFMQCSKLVNVELPSKVKNLDRTFSSCINLETAPRVPDGTLSMNSTFAECTSLQTPTDIPASVTDVSGAFSECRQLGGKMRIDTATEEYSSMFSEAVSSRMLDLTGDSVQLTHMANTCETGNITVNGQTPAKESDSY
jgi:hypothetical protein